MILLPSQKNEIFELIVSYGLNPSQFEFEKVHNPYKGATYATRLSHKESDFYFDFQTASGGSQPHHCAFSPGRDTIEQSAYPGSWAYQIQYFGNWLDYLRREIQIEDKWERLEQEFKELNFGVENSNDDSRFTIIEYEEVCLKVDVIKQRVKELNYPQEQLDRIEKNLDSLKEKAKHLGKLDWKNLFVGTVINIVTQLAMQPPDTHTFIQMIKDVMNPIFLPTVN